MSTEPNPEDVKVQREEDGQWWHPSIPWDDVPEDTDATPLLESLGYEVAFISMESDAPDLADEYYESDDSGMGHWNPSKPGGEGWFLGAIYHSEDGPAACWLRKRMEAKSTQPERREALKSLLDIENDILEAANHIKDTQAGLVEGVLESKTIDPLMDAHERIHEVRRALSEPAVPKAAKAALEAYAKPQRWLRAYQPTGELGLTRCVFTSAGHGFELAQEALAELKETNDEH